MPSFNAHYFFAKEELDFIKKKFPKVEIDEVAMWYGSQGPDLMFFARLMPGIMPGESLMDIGNALHAANPTQILKAIKSFFYEYPKDYIAQSCLLGFICHYVLDRNCHPFVYSREQMIWEDHQNWDRTWIHNVIEHNFDTYIISKYTGLSDARKFKSAKLIPTNKETLMGINRAFAYIIPRVTDIDSDKKYPKAGYYGAKDSHTIMVLLQDSVGWKKSIVGNLINAFTMKKQGPMGTCFFVPKTPMTDYDYFNNEKKEWGEPKNPEFHSSENLDEIFERAYKDLERIMTEFSQAVAENNDDLYSITEDHGFDTTLQSPACENPVIKM